MDGIGDWIKKLRLEIESALSDSRPLPSGARLAADRVTLTLALPARDGSSELANRLTIEFQVRHPELEGIPTPVETVPVPCPPDQLRPLILETAAAVFGPGGFDNSARAEVFCELVSEMEAADVFTALRAIENDPRGVPALPYPAARLHQLLGFSPLGADSAARRLRETLEQSSIADLITILGETWSFGTHWPIDGVSHE